VRYLELDELMVVVRKVTGSEYAVRDKGLLASAVERPRATVFGDEAYGTLHEKAAALLHSLARNHALVDGNKRTAWLACLATLRFNGLRTPAPETEEAASYVEAIARGEVEVPEIAKRLREWFPAY
jgi:death-on-curing protein